VLWSLILSMIQWRGQLSALIHHHKSHAAAISMASVVVPGLPSIIGPPWLRLSLELSERKSKSTEKKQF
jgi:hypothetical protein